MPCAPHARATRMPCILPTTTAQILKSCGFPYPITLSMCGVLFSALVSHIALRTGLVPFGRPDLLGSSRFYLRSSLPIGCLAALTLGLGNMSYMHLSVAACQILKTLTPVITLGLGGANPNPNPNPNPSPNPSPNPNPNLTLNLTLTLPLTITAPSLHHHCTTNEAAPTLLTLPLFNPM